MAKGSGSTKTSTSRNPRGLSNNVSSSLESYVEGLDRQGLLTIDLDDALYESISNFSASSIEQAIESATEYDVMNIQQNGSFVSADLMNRTEEFEDGDDGFRSIIIAGDTNMANVLKQLNSKRLRPTTGGRVSLEIR